MKAIARPSVPTILLGLSYAAILLGYIALIVPNSLRIHEPRTFGDSNEYLNAAQLPVLSASFWTQMKPPVTAFFYKLNGAAPDRIFTFQLWFSSICWSVLALATAGAVRSLWLKPLAFGLILAFSLSRDVVMWIPFIGSESVSFGLLALFVAAMLWLITDWKRYKIPILVVVGFLMVFSRDTAAALLVIAVVMMLPFFLLSRRRFELLAIAASFLGIVAGSVLAGNIARRFEVVFPIIAGLRIFPNPEYVAFFKSQGMPVDPSLVERSDPNSPLYAKWDVTEALWSDPKQAEFRRWMHEHGAAAYVKFIWFFKADTLQRMFIEDGGRNVFYPDVYYYTATGYRPIVSDQRIAEFLYPTRFGLLYFFLANIAAALALGAVFAARRWIWMIPITMILATYPQAFLVWNADANDIPRHSVGHNITERLGMWILVLLVIDFLAQLSRPVLRRLGERARSR